MKVALLAESPIDVAGFRILVEALLSKPIEIVSPSRFEMRGWPSIRSNLSPFLIELHYQTEAEGLAVLVDGDNSPSHHPSHDQPGGIVFKCRFCYLLNEVNRTQRDLRPRSGRAPIKTAIGVAAPTLEAWYLCDRDPNATEAAWNSSGLSKRTGDYRRELKRKVYGTERITTSHEPRAVEEALRLAQNLSLLEKLFPIGFGALAQSIRGW